MSVKIITRKLEARELSVKLVDGSLVRGKINLHHDEHMIQRVSEIFTQVMEPFLVPGGQVGRDIKVFRDLSKGLDVDEEARKALLFVRGLLK